MQLGPKAASALVLAPGSAFQEERPSKHPKLADTAPAPRQRLLGIHGTESALKGTDNQATSGRASPTRPPCEASQGSSDAEDGAKDDSEDRKLRRKQSNRESARRSRLRKQAESEALSTTVSDLQQENFQLRTANKALAARVEELVEKLDEKAANPACIIRPTPRSGAFRPVLPTRQPLKLDARPVAATSGSQCNGRLS